MNKRLLIVVVRCQLTDFVAPNAKKVELSLVDIPQMAPLQLTIC